MDNQLGVENLNLRQWNTKEFEKEKKRMEVGVFYVVRLCESTSTGCSQWATSLLYSLYDILDEYNVL